MPSSATTSTRARHILVFEPDERGHAEEWILHIVRFLRDERPNIRVTMAIPQSLARRLAAEMPSRETLAIVPLSQSELRGCLNANLAFSAFARWWAMRRHLARSGADEALFLCIDPLSLPFALGLGLGGRTASGILFRPSVHYASFGRTPPTLGERLRDRRKRILYPLMLKNSTVRQVHSLDPYFPAFARESYVAGDKVLALDDPLAGESETPGPSVRSPRFPRDRIAFLLFGELTERKGVLQLLHACERLDPEIASRTAVLLAGRIDPPIEDEVRDLVRAIRAVQPDLWLEVDDRRLSFAELTVAVQGCDVVMAPYQRFVGSSGVLIWAARACRPVLTQRYGLLCRLVRDYGLGVTADTTSPDALAGAIEHAVRIGPRTLIDQARARQFVANRDGRHFASQLLNVREAERDHAAVTPARARRANAS